MWVYEAHTRGRCPLVLAGYSFGAWIAARAAGGIKGLGDLLLVAYPFSATMAPNCGPFRAGFYFVGGTFDDVSPQDQLLDCYREVQAEKYLKLLPTSHFFPGVEKDIRDFGASDVRCNVKRLTSSWGSQR